MNEQDKDPIRSGHRGQRKTQDPCPDCFLHKTLCICASIPRLNLKTRVALVIHAKELKRTTNTGSLALKALTNSQMLIRGNINEPLDLKSLLSANYRTLLFYPSPDAVELTRAYIEQSGQPIQLIVPDGNWRQASKIHYRYPEMKSIPRVMIKGLRSPQYVMRTESKAEGMTTLEAVAEALGVIEGSHIKNQLLSLYNKKLENTLVGRGLIKLRGPDTEILF